MKRKPEQEKNYEERLQTFLGRIKRVEQGKRKEELYEIMDMVVFRDLETALMMATMKESGSRAGQ